MSLTLYGSERIPKENAANQRVSLYHTLPLSHSHTLTLSHSHTLTLSHSASRTLSLTHSPTHALSHALPHALTQPLSHTVNGSREKLQPTTVATTMSSQIATALKEVVPKVDGFVKLTDLPKLTDLYREPSIST